MDRRGAETQRVNEIPERIIGCAIEVHRHLGPGLLESAYEECTCHEITQAGLKVQRQVLLPVTYKQIVLDCGYRMDAVVEGAVIVEFKTVERLLPVHDAQLLSYLKLSGLRVGLLINFHVPVLKDGLKRIVNHFGELSASPRLCG
jgi:GxxExxY protein